MDEILIEFNENANRLEGTKTVWNNESKNGNFVWMIERREDIYRIELTLKNIYSKK